MDNIKKEIFLIKKDIKKTRDIVEKIILQDILEKKINEYEKLRILNNIENEKKKKIIENEIDLKLDKIIEVQKEEYDDIKNDAYNKLLEENENEIKKEGNDRYWNKKIDPKYKKEVEYDYSNNKLMDRLNSELNFRIEGNKKNVIKPYYNKNESDDSEDENKDDNYEFVNIKKFNNHSIPSNNFSNDRLLGSRKNL